MAPEYDLVVIGGGSGGLACAQRAAEYGARALVIERHRLGGTCVNVGCVPKKVMWNAGQIAHALHDAPDYGFQVSVAPHDWAQFKRKRDEYVARLNFVYERNLERRQVQLLREQLRLTGTHIGCDTSQCGACVVHVDGRAVKSCTLFAVQAEGAEVTTIEGLAKDGKLHPVQEAFRENHGLQCGFCTPGMIMTAVDMIRRRPQLDRDTIRHELEGNICRCTGYHNIVSAIEDASRRMAGGAK